MQCIRVYCEQDLQAASGRVELDLTESHHLTKVRRAREGARVVLFNTHAEWVEGVLCACGDGRRDPCVIEYRVGDVHTQAARSVERVLIQALPKGKVMDELIRPLCEIGVDRIIPVLSEHTEKRWRSEVHMHEQLERWRRLSIEAAKQSGNLRLPKIDTPAPLATALDAYEGQLLIASLESDARSLDTVELEGASFAWCVGPEGDWSSAEYALLKVRGAWPIRLADYVLRAETASLYAVSVLDYQFVSREPRA